jgi:hypothetical protein
VPAMLRKLAVTAATATVAALAPVAAVMPAASAAPGGAATMARAAAGARPASSVRPAARPAARPGKVGKTITLANNVTLSEGYDAVTVGGATYIGWIGNVNNAGRRIFLCVLPSGRTSCAGGVASTDSLGSASAEGLHVLANAGGGATLIWFHDTTASGSGPNGAKIATATAGRNGSLSGASDLASAPSFGTLFDAARGPNGSIWVVTQPSSEKGLEVRPGLGNAAVSLSPPYMVGNAQLAFSGSTAVLAIQWAAALTRPVSYARKGSGGWSRFHTVARTWTAGANLGLVHTGSGIRLLAAINNADFWPVVSRWTGSSFSRRQLTGDRHACAPSSHDPVADASGRMADVSEECTDVAVANLTDTLHAAVVRFGSGGTLAGGPPQITTTSRGRGWVVWSIESSGTADKLVASRILLPGRTHAVRKTSRGNRVQLTGPASCLPPVSVTVKVTGSPASGWRVVSRSIHLGGKKVSGKLSGSSLTAGKHYTLSGKVIFGNGGARRTVTARLKFRSCPN